MNQEVKIVRLCPKCGPTTNYDFNLKCSACGENTKEEVIAGGDIGMAPPPPIATGFGEARMAGQGARRECQAYGKEIPIDTRYCPYCNTAIPDSRVSPQSVNALATIGGIFGMHGLGHISIGNISMGFLALFAGWVLIAGGLLAYFLGWEQYGETTYIALIAILALAYILLFIWQVMSTNSEARKLNQAYEKHRMR